MIDPRRHGPWALVTGASSGIGEQFARALAARGLHLVLTARRLRELEALASSLRAEHGVEVRVVAADLSRLDILDALTPACADVDVGLVVANAGFGLKGEHHTLDPARLTAMLLVNCHAPMLLANAFAPRLLARGRGGFVFTSSIEAFLPFPWSSAYAASKAFLSSLGEGVGEELRSGGIDVLVLSPGATDTAAPISQGVDRRALVGLMPPEAVVRGALAHLGRASVYVPGWTNRLLIGFLTALPRRLAVRLAAKGMRDALVRPELPARSRPEVRR
jgi:short-subunit dehydrogenase